MKLLRLLIILVAGVVIIRYLPAAFVPEDWRGDYYEWAGESRYSEPAPTLESSMSEVDLDAVCPPAGDADRRRQTIAGVEIEAVDDCLPDNPYDIAVSVLGSNNVSADVLMRSLFAPDTIEKQDDIDGDGDPDRIHIRLELIELNGHSPEGPVVLPHFEIAPGVAPGAWIFTPKSRGMSTVDFESVDANRLLRLPAPAIRVEQGDEVSVTLENTHYLPHTIHFHGVDHPFVTESGEGNEGVPIFSEHPIEPGQQRTYRFRPRQPGTAFYHCHVQPHTHILMGLQGLFIVEENRPNNTLQTFNIGAGRVRVRSTASRIDFDREYDLHYTEIDRELNNRIQLSSDPRRISRAIHRDYNITQRVPEYFLLNGRSFPYTLQESLIVTAENERAHLRILNAGSEGIALHFHGHKPELTHRDGVALTTPEQRDVFWIAPAQRADLALLSTNDGLHNYGKGAWLLHDHREKAVTTDGIGPGGDVSLVVDESYIGERGLPQPRMGLEKLALFFNPAYYRGELPVFTGMGMDYLGEPAHRHDDRRSIFWIALMVMLITLLSPWRRK